MLEPTRPGGTGGAKTTDPTQQNQPVPSSEVDSQDMSLDTNEDGEPKPPAA